MYTPSCHQIVLLAWLLMGVGPGCGSSSDDPSADVAGEMLTDVPGDQSSTLDEQTETLPGASCGNSECDAGENCLFCPQDCGCVCGDGVCTHGEFCVVCPQDCDCSNLAATPPMGWNSWNLYACDIDEVLFQETAQALVDSGMAAVGYRFVNIDDCWQTDRDEAGNIVVDEVRFPGGMKALAGHIHDLGLFFGTYTCAGTMTCQERPGSYLFEDQDMATYADWGVDYVKVDWCFSEGLDAPERYAAFRDAIADSGRQMVLSICNWGKQDPWVWGPETGDLWRTSGDIFDHAIGMSINLETTVPLAPFAVPGHWNDPDMLEVGNGGMTFEQYKAHFSLWSILAAPLIAGNDVRSMDEETRSILLNREVIDVNQDPLGVQGVVVHEEGSVRAFARPLTHDGWRAVVFFNSDVSQTGTGRVSWEELGLAPGTARVRDLWKHADLGEFSEGFEVEVGPIAAVMIRVEGEELSMPSGTASLSELDWKYMANFGGPVQRNRTADGSVLKLNGTEFLSGLGVSGGSRVIVHLGQRCRRFAATVGLDDRAGEVGSVQFTVWADGALLADSGQMLPGNAPVPFDVSVVGARELELRVMPGGDSTQDDLADWAEAIVVCD